MTRLLSVCMRVWIYMFVCVCWSWRRWSFSASSLKRKETKDWKVLYKTEGVCLELHHEPYISMCECVCVDKCVSVLYDYHSANNWKHGMCMWVLLTHGKSASAYSWCRDFFFSCVCVKGWVEDSECNRQLLGDLHTKTWWHSSCSLCFPILSHAFWLFLLPSSRFTTPSLYCLFSFNHLFLSSS